jgi:hypothetical protein
MKLVMNSGSGIGTWKRPTASPVAPESVVSQRKKRERNSIANIKSL